MLTSSTKHIKHLKIASMESYMLSGFVGILRETPKIFSKNGKLMASLTFLYLSLISVSYLFFVFSAKPLLTDLIVKASLIPITDPKSLDFALLLINVKNDIRDFAAFEWIFVFLVTIFSLYFATATIIVSALMHSGKNLSFKEMLLSTVMSLKRPFFTWFFTTLLGLGSVFFFLANLLPVALIVQHPLAMKALAIVPGILAPIFYSYLAVIWVLALVISTLEEKSGIEALGKAAQLVKGMQLHGFVLNLLLSISTLVIFQAPRLMNIKQSAALRIIIGLIVVNFICLVKIFWWMAYTVFYYQCKKIHGEEVELQGSIAYNVIPTSPFLDENIP